MTSSKLANGSATSSTLANGSGTAAKIQNNTIKAHHLDIDGITIPATGGLLGDSRFLVQVNSGNAIIGTSQSLIGTGGLSQSGAGVYGNTPPSGGTAGVFSGNVNISGTLTKGAGAFRIDHPLDPEHKYLAHSFVESPDMMNIYNGNVTLDADGKAWVGLPDWFSALNTDFRYQLTPIGAPGPNLYIDREIAGNRFKIAGGEPGAKVSWQVTGIRQDAFANAHRIQVEQEKSLQHQGYYIHPELYGQPTSKSIDWVDHPELHDALAALQEADDEPGH